MLYIASTSLKKGKDDSIADKVRDILSKWKTEHDGYYGKPHGMKKVQLKIDDGFMINPNGSIFIPNTDNDEGVSDVVECYCGYSESAVLDLPFGRRASCRWLTSGGNDHRIVFRPNNDGYTYDYLVIGYNGRRNGIRSEFVELMKMVHETEHFHLISYRTMTPHLKPWKTNYHPPKLKSRIEFVIEL